VNQPAHTVGELEAAIIDAMASDDWELVATLESELDALEVPRRFELLSSALWYAGQGLHVFPLQPRHKKPYRGSKGLHDATTDLDLIKLWWGSKPTANIGIATGYRVDVIDIDGPKGVKSWSENAEMIAELTHLGHVATPRPGGTHIYIPAVEGRGNKAGLLPGIDYRGTGGYVVAPPSELVEVRDAEGEIEQYAGVYRWRTPLTLEALA
jgi:hypothetical protein